MVARSRTEDQVKAAVQAVEAFDAPAAEKAEMLMEIAMGLQTKPKTRHDLDAAVRLYRLGMELCTPQMALLSARIGARLGTALMAIPSEDSATLEQARAALEQSLGTLTAEGSDEEVAEAEMNLGLVLQHLAGMHKARIQDAIGAYQRALRTFDRTRHPKEFAVLQNNLATAFLSIPFTDEKSKLREALAVQAFEEGLSVVTLVDHPTEFAMLQNNLGNALQHVASSHRGENMLRALDAYDLALKVRTRRDSPGEYANTIANKASCLLQLPDELGDPESGAVGNMRVATELLSEAHDIFAAQGEAAKADSVAEMLRDLRAELAANEK